MAIPHADLRGGTCHNGVIMAARPESFSGRVVMNVRGQLDK